MHISKYIRFGDTLERCCKGKAFIWIVQGILIVIEENERVDTGFEITKNIE